MSIPIEALKRALERAEEELEDTRINTEDEIRAGKAAQMRLESAQEHVNQLVLGIEDLEQAERERQVGA